MATLCLTESIAEAKDNKNEQYIASLVAQKAFDVVHHTILLDKIYQKQISPALQDLIVAMQTKNTKGTHVRAFAICLNMKNGYYRLFLGQNLKFYILLMVLKSKIICISICTPCMNEFNASV